MLVDIKKPSISCAFTDNAGLKSMTWYPKNYTMHTHTWRHSFQKLLAGRLLQRRGSCISLYAILIEFLHRLRTKDILEHAYSVAFNLTLSIFPATILLFTLLPYIPWPSLDQKIITLLQEALPEGLYAALTPTIQDTLETQRTGLLSLGLISTLYLSTNGMMSLIKTFDLFCQDIVPEQRSYFRKRMLAFSLMLFLGLVLLCAIVLLTAGSQALKYMLAHGFIASRLRFNLILVLRLITIALIFLVAISCIYYFAPSKRHQWPFFSAGACLATVLSLFASFGFSYYLNNFANYNRIYGSLGVIIALMTWLFLLSAILLIGFEFNASIDALSCASLQEGTKQEVHTPDVIGDTVIS